MSRQFCERHERNRGHVLVDFICHPVAQSVLGFEKNDRANIDEDERVALQILAADLLACTTVQLTHSVEDGTLLEICHDHTH